MIYVTAICSAILALMFIKLSFNVIELRRMHKVPFGVGGIDALDRAIRAHANFAEYIPVGLILMATLELNGAPWIWVAVLGSCLVLGRHFHAKGIRQDEPDFESRVTGMKFTLVAIALLAVSNLVWVAYSLIVSARFVQSLYAN
jgi:uncharacterized membrane protein YecN with MAPEG domain